MITREEASQLLLGDRLAPITSAMGFIEADSKKVEKHYVGWHNELEKRFKTRVRISTRPVSGSLESVLRSLLPLNRGQHTRTLLIPTRSRWTAFVDNGVLGTDPTAVLYLPTRIGCQSVHMVAEPNELRLFRLPPLLRLGAVVFRLYGSHNLGQWGNLIREIWLDQNAMWDWEFNTTGAALPFEETGAYKALIRTERFNLRLLRKYLLALDIDAFNERFYLPPEQPTATLIEISGGWTHKVTTASLEEARSWEHPPPPRMTP